MGFDPSIHPPRECGLGQTEIIANNPASDSAQLYGELWVSLASLLRSYTAAHGLNGKRQATVELGEDRILVRHGDNWLDLQRSGASVNWKREDGRTAKLEFTEHGRLRELESNQAGLNVAGGEEMDMAAERWARDLMRESQQ
jgi:hypothetical protein